jgi:hypothetical protein
MAGMLVV